jgi:hypothetical protein
MLRPTMSHRTLNQNTFGTSPAENTRLTGVFAGLRFHASPVARRSCRHTPQCSIPRKVAVGVVVLFEIVDINQEE